MKRRGLSANRVATMTNGAISARAVAQWLNGGNPRQDKLLEVARLFGPIDGPALLEAYGFTEMATGLAEELSKPRTVRRDAGHLTPEEEHDAIALIREKLEEVAQLVAEFERRREQ